MRLTKLSLWNAAPIGTREIFFGRVTAIVGPLGAGKSTLLAMLDSLRERVAPVAPLRGDLERFIGSAQTSAKFLLELGFDEQEQGRFALAATTDAEVLVGKGETVIDCSAELQSALRWPEVGGAQGIVDFVPTERIPRLGNGTFRMYDYVRASTLRGPAKYEWLEAAYCDAALAPALGAPALATKETINGRLERVSSHLRLVGAERFGGGAHLPVFATAGGKRVGLFSLSSGERQLTFFVGLLSVLEPRRSILIVDNLERDLDGGSQLALLQLLAENDNQVIFATCSDVLRRSPDVTTTIQLGTLALPAA